MKTLLSNLIFLLIAGALTVGIATVAYKIAPTLGNKADIAGFGQPNKDNQLPVSDNSNKLQNTLNNIADQVKQATQNIQILKPATRSSTDTRIRSSEGDENENEKEGDDDEGGSFSVPPPITLPSGTTQSYSASQVTTHNSQSSCWTIINGNVYDLTGWISQHPGGEGTILSICGIDGSAAFNGQHGGSGRPEQILQSYLLSSLK